MTAVDLSLLADQIRAELVGRGEPVAPIHDESAVGTVRFYAERDAAAMYVAARLAYVIHHFERGPEASGMCDDARIALGEYAFLLRMDQEAAA